MLLWSTVLSQLKSQHYPLHSVSTHAAQRIHPLVVLWTFADKSSLSQSHSYKLYPFREISEYSLNQLFIQH